MVAMALVVMRFSFGDLLLRHLHVVIGLQYIVGNRSICLGFVHGFLLNRTTHPHMIVLSGRAEQARALKPNCLYRLRAMSHMSEWIFRPRLVML